MDKLANTLHITSPQGWYDVTNVIIQNHGGAGLLCKFGSSVPTLLSHVYPEYPLACRDTLFKLKDQLSLKKIEDLIQCSNQYHACSCVLMYIEQFIYTNPPYYDSMASQCEKVLLFQHCIYCYTSGCALLSRTEHRSSKTIKACSLHWILERPQ